MATLYTREIKWNESMENMECKLNRDNVAIVLVEPIRGGNIGSVARGMINMGFSDLRIVNPEVDPLNDEARMMAHGSVELLEKAKIFKRLEEAVADCALIVGTSHKVKRDGHPTLSAREIGPKLAPYCEKNKVAILFGRESRGLSNEELYLCTWLVNIPSHSFYPSLNLAQAVLVVCYELFMASTTAKISAMPELAQNVDVEKFLDYVSQLLDMAGFHHKNGVEAVYRAALRRV